jgi:hypothetical protein
MPNKKAPPVKHDDPTMRGPRARTLEGDLRAKRSDTLVGTIEKQYGVDLGVRSDMELGTLRERVGEHELAKVIAKAQAEAKK